MTQRGVLNNSESTMHTMPFTNRDDIVNFIRWFTLRLPQWGSMAVVWGMLPSSLPLRLAA